MKIDSSTECWDKCWGSLTEKWMEDDERYVFRNCFIMPFTLSSLGDVKDKKILDLGCGEGGYSRRLAERGAKVTAIDASINAIDYSIEKAEELGLCIEHYVRNSNDLYEIDDSSFDIVLASMMLMDCEDLEGTLNEISRVIVSKGRLFVSVLHPCFNGKKIHSQIVDGKKERIINDYFSPRVWEAPIPAIGDMLLIWRKRTLEEYVSAFTANNFIIRDLYEPQLTEEALDRFPKLEILSRIPLFLFFNLMKK